MFILALLSLLVVAADAQRQFSIQNSCPAPIKLFVNGKVYGTIPAGGQTTRTLPRNWSGFIYSNANGGNANGVRTTRAGFYGESDYYYIVKDASYFNTGVSIEPKKEPSDGFCLPDACNDKDCSNAYTSPPTRFPRPSRRAPVSPLFACPRNPAGYTVTFCPSGSFPPNTEPTEIHPNGVANKCLDVRGGIYQNGTPVQIYDCNGTPAQQWIVSTGPTTSVRLAGTPFCLDAGSSPANGIPLKIWTCYASLPAQTWQYAANKLYLANTDQCLDNKKGGLGNGNVVQTWGCRVGNTNQVWTT